MPYVKIHHEIDPKQKILDEIGDLSGVDIADNNVVVAVYQRPNTMKVGGKVLELAPVSIAEDRYQSKVGLIVAHGPQAFKDPNGVFFNGVDFKIGDWKWVEMYKDPFTEWEKVVKSHPMKANFKERVILKFFNNLYEMKK